MRPFQISQDFSNPRTNLSQSDIKRYFRTRESQDLGPQTHEGPRNQLGNSNQFEMPMADHDLEGDGRYQELDYLNKYRHGSYMHMGGPFSGKNQSDKSLDYYALNRDPEREIYQWDKTLMDQVRQSNNSNTKTNYMNKEEGGLFSKLGRQEVDEAEKKRKYKEELDRLVRMKNEGAGKDNSRRRIDRSTDDLNKENRPANMTGVRDPEWERKRKMAEELMKDLLAKNKTSSEPFYPSYGDQMYGQEAEDDRRQALSSQYINEPMEYGGGSYGTGVGGNGAVEYSKVYGDYERENQKSNDWEKKIRYKQELDAQLEMQKRNPESAVKKDTRVPDKQEQGFRDTFFLFKAQEDDEQRVKRRNMEMQKYAEELKKQMQEREEQKKREKLEKKEREARERNQLAGELETNGPKKANPAPLETQKPIEDYKRSVSPPNKKVEEAIPYRWQEDLYMENGPGSDLQARRTHSQGFVPGPNNQGAYNINPYEAPENPPFLPYENFGGYEARPAGFSSYGHPWGGQEMYGGGPNMPMHNYQQLMFQIMKDRLRIETFALQEKLLFEQYRNKLKEIKLGQLGSEQGANNIRAILSQQPLGFNFPHAMENPAFMPVSQPVQNILDINTSEFEPNIMKTPQNKSRLLLINDLDKPSEHGLTERRDLLEQSMPEINQTLPCSQDNFEIPPEELEKSYLKDLGIFMKLHRQVFDLESPVKDVKEESITGEPKSHILPSNSSYEASSLMHGVEGRTSERQETQRMTANPLGGNPTYSSLLQYSDSKMDHTKEKSTRRGDDDRSRQHLEGTLVYNVDNVGIMMTPDTGVESRNNVGKMDTTSQVRYESTHRTKDGDGTVDRISEFKEEVSAVQDGSLVGGQIKIHQAERKPKLGEEESKVEESEMSERGEAIPVETIEQKLEINLVDVGADRSLILVEDEEEEEEEAYDTTEMRDFVESHEKLLQEIRMDMSRAGGGSGWYRDVPAVEETERELLEIVKEAKKAVGIEGIAMPPVDDTSVVNDETLRQEEEYQKERSCFEEKWVVDKIGEHSGEKSVRDVTYKSQDYTQSSRTIPKFQEVSGRKVDDDDEAVEESRVSNVEGKLVDISEDKESKRELEDIEKRIRRKREYESQDLPLKQEKSRMSNKEDCSRNRLEETENHLDSKNTSKDTTKLKIEDLQSQKGDLSDNKILSKSSNRVVHEKRSKTILAKLERLLEGWGDEDEEESERADRTGSLEVSKDTPDKSAQQSEGLFRPFGAQKSVSKRYNDSEEL